MENIKENKPKPIVFRQGERLYLRPISRNDIPELTRWINDPAITPFLKATFPMTEEEEMRWFEKKCSGNKEDLIFMLALNDTDELIGNMGLHKIDYRNGTATTGSIIGKQEYWDKGYGTEAKMLLLEYAFNTLNLRKICSRVYDFNARSKKCLEKCGYKIEGILKDHVYRNGKYADVHVMAIFKEDFLRLWNKTKEK